MIKWIKKCWNNDVMRYIFFGGCTTFVNLACCYTLWLTTPIDRNIANTISIVVAILFAYFVNSRFVFRSEAQNFKQRFEEFCKFVGARVSTLIIEVGGVWLMADIMGINEYIAKFLIQFIVLVLNYVFSKFLIFVSKKTE